MVQTWLVATKPDAMSGSRDSSVKPIVLTDPSFCVSGAKLYRLCAAELGRCIFWEQQHFLGFISTHDRVDYRKRQHRRGVLNKLAEAFGLEGTHFFVDHPFMGKTPVLSTPLTLAWWIRLVFRSGAAPTNDLVAKVKLLLGSVANLASLGMRNFLRSSWQAKIRRA